MEGYKSKRSPLNLCRKVLRYHFVAPCLSEMFKLIFVAAILGAASSAPPPTCRAPGDRCAGAYGYPKVPWIPCCDGSCSESKYGQWGSFCSGIHELASSGTDAPSRSPIDEYVQETCYPEQHRCQRASGKPTLGHKRCCGGLECVDAPDWGKWCVVPCYKDNCTKPMAPLRRRKQTQFLENQGPSRVVTRSIRQSSPDEEFFWWFPWPLPSPTPLPQAPSPSPNSSSPPLDTPTPSPDLLTPPQLPEVPAPSPTASLPLPETPTTPPGTSTPPPDTPTPFPDTPTPSPDIPTAPPQLPEVPNPSPQESTPPSPTFTPPPNPPTPSPDALAPPQVPEPTTPDSCEGIGGKPRPDAGSISQEDWDCFASGIIALKSKPSSRYQNLSVLDEFSRLHRDHGQHFGASFLMWHRVMLWEFEKELNTVAPGCRIPAYDWAREGENALRSSLYQSDRAGGSEPFERGNPKPIVGGSFVGLTTEAAQTNNEQPVLRNFRSTPTLHDTESIASSSAALTTYAQFNAWLEGVHGNFHFAIGGTMGDTRFSPSEPSFYMHHAFIDKLWRQWQQGTVEVPGRGSDFGGRQPNRGGSIVSPSTRMEPWGTPAQDTLERISSCVDYANADGTVVSREIILSSPVRAGAAVSNETESTSDTNRGRTKGEAAVDYEVVPVISEAEKDDRQLEIAEKKIQDPEGYEAKVLKADRVKNTCVAALRELKFPESYIELFQRLEGYVLLVAGGVDLGDAEVAQEAAESGNTDIIVAEGKEEKEAIEHGNDLGSVNPKKTSETESYSVVTWSPGSSS